MIAIDDTPLESPTYFESAGLTHSKSVAAYEMIQNIGQQLTRGEELRAALTWEAFVDSFLPGTTTAEVEIVRRQFDVVDHRSCRCYDDETVLMTYRSER